MAATRWDFTIAQGATFRVTKDVFDDDDLPLDLSTGYEARMQARQDFGSADTIFSLDDIAGLTLDDGTIDILIDAVDTAALDFLSPARYDLEVEDYNGEVTRLFFGYVGLSREISEEAS